MCGIYAQFGSFKINDALKCLKKLEYRGYDSYGIGYGNNQIYKNIGRIDFVNEDENLMIKKAICHTRWATNGSVNVVNAHPQISSDKQIILVHNGILENESIIKDTYFKNHQFLSDTDTEVITELLSFFIKRYPPFDAIKRVMEIIKGSYAIIFMIKDDENIYFMKNKSSLLLGYNDTDYYLASDIYAFKENTKYYKHISDMSFGCIGPNMYLTDQSSFILYSFNFNDPKEQIMLDEIGEEEKLALNIFNNFKADEKLLKLLEETSEFVLIGSGSSFYASEYIALMIEQELGIRARAFLPTEYSYNDIYNKSTFIFISQSGETADVLAAIDKIKPKKAMLITNSFTSQMTLHIPLILDMHAGKEIAVASTKSFNQSVLVFYTLIKQFKGEEPKEILNYVKNLEEIKKTFDNNNIPKEISKMKNVFYLGHGYDYIISKEGALKLKEIAYIPTEGYSTSELKHGSLALISDKSAVIGLSSNDSFLISCLNEVRARGGKVFFLKNKYPGGLLGALSLSRYVQLIAYYTAKELGNDPDHPRNLAKSVTVI